MEKKKRKDFHCSVCNTDYDFSALGEPDKTKALAGNKNIASCPTCGPKGRIVVLKNVSS